MEDYLGLFLLAFVCLTSCRAQQDFRPTNLTAVYVADGTIRVTWDPPTTLTGLTRYHVKDEGTGTYGYVNLNQRVYSYNTTKPNTTYSFRVSSISNRVRGSSQTTITTPTAKYRRIGLNTRLKLPKPPGGLSTIKFNGLTLFSFSDDGRIGNNTGDVNNRITVNVTSSNTILIIDSLETNQAGYYYTMQQSGNGVLGGEFLVVTDQPTKPTIIASPPSPVLGTNVALACSSSSQSKPDNHGLVLTASWKLNGNELKSERFSFNGSNLTISAARIKDKDNKYTCVAEETGQGVDVLYSEESGEFKLTPRYGPQFVRIEGTEGKSPVIRGDVYGPVVCRTDCNPPCLLEWRRQGSTLITSRGTSSNQLELEDRNLPRVKEVIYSCHVQVKSSAGFSAPSMENNITVTVYYPANITELKYKKNGTFIPVGSIDVRYTESSSLEMSVEVDGNPDSNVSLLRNETKHAVGVPVGTGRKYNVKLDNLQCNHTGRYDVRAVNFVTRNRSNANPSSRQFGLQVSCNPRRYYSGNRVIKVAGKTGDTILLNVVVIANPKPIISWSEGVGPTDVRENNTYTYTVSGEVTVTETSDFGNYHVNVSNNNQSLLTIPFEILQEDVPDKPKDFEIADVGYDIIKVKWTPGFNGGNDQLFHIEIKTTGNKWSTYILDIMDEGQGKMMFYTIKNLTSSTDYDVRLNVSNKIGLGASSIIEKIRTLEKPQPISTKSNKTVIIVVVILVMLVVVAVILGISILVVRRRQQGRPARRKVETANNEYSGVPGGDAARNNTAPAENENNEYAVVYKPPKGGAAKSAASNTDNEYAVVSKPAKGGVATDNEYAVVSKPSKGQKQNLKNGGSQEPQPGPSSHEPQPGPSSQEPQPGPSRTVNEDGLIYIDVEIKQQPGRGKAIIHGAEDRTAYALVDFSKTAPEPSQNMTSDPSQNMT